MEIFIKGNVPSSKNSKIATSKGVFHSKTVMNYLRSLGIQHYSVTHKTVMGYKTKPNLFRQAFKDWEKPTEFIKLGLHFIRDSKRDADFTNICQIIFDLMVAHDFIEDDSMRYVLPFPLEIDGEYFSYSKENPGVIIRVLN